MQRDGCRSWGPGVLLAWMLKSYRTDQSNMFNMLWDVNRLTKFMTVVWLSYATILKLLPRFD